MSKVYTKTGDLGETSLIGGQRVRKDDLRVEAYGTVDELNAHVGLLAEMVHGDALSLVQNDLFSIQTLLAAPDPSALPPLPPMATQVLEQAIDNIQSQLPELHAFVLPGGNPAAAQCHVARTVCRRAERRIVSLSQHAPVDPDILSYINRLSDYLFVLARLLVVHSPQEEKVWKAQ